MKRVFLLLFYVTAMFSVAQEPAQTIGFHRDGEPEVFVPEPEKPQDSPELAYFRYTILAEHQVKIVQYTGNDQEVEIPSTLIINGEMYTVVEIGEKAFSGKSSLKKITIPNTILSVGSDAFAQSNLVVDFKGSVGDWARINFSSWSSNPVACEDQFYLNDSLFDEKKLVIPDSIKKIGNYAFRAFGKIDSLVISNGVECVGKAAFLGCENMVSVSLPESVKEVQYMAFSRCNALEEIVVDSANQIYDSREKCNAIVDTKTNTLIVACNKSIIPNTIQKIGDYSFYDCDRLKSLILPSSIECIGINAFESCDSLVSIKLNEGLKYIHGYAFISCYSLESIDMPNTVTSIGDGAFSGCTNLRSVKLSNALTSLSSRMFAQCKSLTEVIIPNSVTYIGDYAFYDCTSLTSLSIPSSITTVGICAFSYIPSLKYVTIHNAPKDMVFFQCPSLTHITWNVKSGVDSQKPFDRIKNQIISFTFGENVEYIPKELCCGMSNLQSIEIPKNIKRIGYHAFYYCDKLTSVTWNATDCTIEDYVFYDVFYASKIKSFTFGENVKVIPEALCKGMSSLTSITIPNNVQKIGKNVFEKCTNITSVEWNAHSTCAVQLENNRITSPFSSIVTQITSISFGNSVETIPACLCIGMTKLETIEIPQSVTSIGQHAFCDCYGLKKITIPKSVIEIGPSAFKNMGYFDDIQVMFCGKVNPENIFQWTWMRKDYTFYVPAEYLRYYKSFSKKQLGISKGSVRYKTF